jgi:hypothetical protein
MRPARLPAARKDDLCGREESHLAPIPTLNAMMPCSRDRLVNARWRVQRSSTRSDKPAPRSARGCNTARRGGQCLNS